MWNPFKTKSDEDSFELPDPQVKKMMRNALTIRTSDGVAKQIWGELDVTVEPTPEARKEFMDRWDGFFAWLENKDNQGDHAWIFDISNPEPGKMAFTRSHIVYAMSQVTQYDARYGRDCYE